ncbi:MAG: dipeptidase PepE [Flavobacteriales bacterium]|nr:dipeptidase PepE [Flavobacteriales bacterium]
MELLLLSNSTLPGEPFFTWPRPFVAAFLQGKSNVAFAPFAAMESQQDEYTDRVREVFASLGVELVGLHRERDPVAALDRTDAVVVGGGNTFLLLRSLYRTQLVRAIAEKVRHGMPYLGWSAGSNVACPTVMTTNDMPIVETPSLKAMHLVPFQINPHYTEATIPGHGGESRDQRISEFLAANPSMPVVGLREGSLLHVKSGQAYLHGSDMRLFRHGRGTVDVANGSSFRLDLTGL